ncbi:MAG: acyl-CoA thioesterase [Sphingomonadales bacterium]
MGVFSTDIPIRFADCDLAGVMFYPRLIERIQQVVERWFDQGLGLDFHQVHVVNGWGLPTVDLHCEFVHPSRLGDVLSFTLWLEKIGRTSFIVRIEARCGGEMRAKARLVMVMRSFYRPENTEIPTDLRTAMGKFLNPPGPEQA